MRNELDGKLRSISQEGRWPPFRHHKAFPNTTPTSVDALAALGLRPEEKALLFFGRITPCIVLDLLVEALASLRERHPEYRLLVAGRSHTHEFYLRVQEVIKRTDARCHNPLHRVCAG